MYRTAFVGVLLVLCGCGSGSASDGEPKKPSRSETPSASYFVIEDTAGLNQAAATAQTAGTRARAVRNLEACNKIDAYPAWRRCWHGLLDPFAKGLTDLGGEFTSLATGTFPASCVAELEKGAQTFAGFAREVDALLAGIDSSDRRAQVKATRAYQGSLDGIGEGFNKPFQDITQVCYSPEDLASINASPKPKS